MPTRMKYKQPRKKQEASYNELVDEIICNADTNDSNALFLAQGPDNHQHNHHEEPE